MTTTGQVRSSFPAYRVFIFGVEVTEDVLSCVINFNDGRAPNTCEFVLDNKLDKYTVVEPDLALLYGNIDLDSILAETSNDRALTEERALQTIKGRIEDAFSPDSTKGVVYTAKISERQKVTQADLRAQADGLTDNQKSTPSRIAALTGDALRYPLQLGDPIFHSNDPVRIFWRDMDEPSVWYHMFSGFMTSHNDILTADGETTLTLRCEDVLRILRYSRISTNPALYDIKATLTQYDTLFQSFFKDGFSSLTLQEILSLLIFGSTATGLDGAIGAVSTNMAGLSTTNSKAKIKGAALPGYQRIGAFGKTESKSVSNGVGAFNFKDSRVFVLGPAIPTEESPTSFANIPVEHLDSLFSYQLRIDHEVEIGDLTTLLGPDMNQTEVNLLTSGITSVSDVISVMGTHPEIWPVDFGRLIMLIPASLGTDVSRNILLRDLIDSFATTTQFTTRLTQIFDFCKRIEFSFYATPKGDLVLEMPLYDFDPDDFGEFYASRYTFTRSGITSWDKGFDDEKVRTQFRVPYQLARGISLGVSDNVWQEPGVAQLDALIPQFGVRMEMSDPYGFIASKEAAATYANLKLNQWNADARSAQIGVTPRLVIGPNRPLKFLIGQTDAPNSPLRRAFIATCRNVTSSIIWGSSVEMSVGMNYIRGWDGQLTAEGQRLFSPLGGYASRPLNYNLIFNAQAAKAEVAASTKSLSEQTTAPPQGPNQSLAKVDIENNVAFVKKQVDVIAERLSSLRGGVPISGKELINNVYRSSAKNKASGGIETSLHQVGLATDIFSENSVLAPLNKKLTDLGQPPVTMDEAESIVKGLIFEGAIAPGLVLGPQEPDAHHQNHIHYGINEGRRQTYWPEGT